MKKLEHKQLNVLHICFILLLGVVLFTSVFFSETDKSKKYIEKHMRDMNDYIENKCVEYDGINVGTSMKSLFSVSDKTVAIRELIAFERSDETSVLEEVVVRNRLSGAIVVNLENGNISEYTDGLGYSQWTSVFEKFSSVSKNLNKTYCDRNFLSDGSCYDYAICGRTDCVGLILAYVRYSANEVISSQMSVKNLLEGYKFESDGVIVITDGERVIASNNASDVGLLASECPIVKELRLVNGYDRLVKSEDRRFFALCSKTDNYYIYTYVPMMTVFSERNMAMAWVTVVYFFFVMIVFFILQHIEKVRRDEQELSDKKYRQELTDLTAQAVHANDVKTEFLRRMSHDIRTPINGIRGMVEIGNYFADDLEKQQECRDKVWRASQYLLELVNDALDITKFDSKEFELKEYSFSMSGLLEDVRKINEYKANENGVNFSFEKEVTHDELIGADVQLKRVLTNLLGNAVKYNVQNGDVVLSCRELSFDGERAEYEFVCKDTGIGISEDFQKIMFEPFAREYDDYNKYGVGLGLSIVKKIVDKMGGTVEVKSKQGEGSTFTVRLSFRVDRNRENPSKKAEIDKSREKPLEGVRVLVAEDNEINYEIVDFVLETAGAEVIWAKDGCEALDAFFASEPYSFDVVLMDVLMPNLDGNATAERIRKSDRPDADVVIISMTANTFEDDLKHNLDSGMNDNLSKPLDSQKMIKTILKYIKKE